MGIMNTVKPDNQRLQRIYIPLGLAAAFVLLILGLFLPVMHLKELVIFKSTFSVVTGIQGLFHEGHYGLAIILFLFSVVFPIFKLAALCALWSGKMVARKRERFLHWLAVLGKWSMLDVFVVAVTIVITKISKLAAAEPRAGIYFFCASVVLTMFITGKITKTSASA